MSWKNRPRKTSIEYDMDFVDLSFTTRFVNRAKVSSQRVSRYEYQYIGLLYNYGLSLIVFKKFQTLFVISQLLLITYKVHSFCVFVS